jgi:chromosome segregation ATPase
MKNNFITLCGIAILIFSIALIAFQSGKNSIKHQQAKSEIRTSERLVKTYQKEYDSIQAAYSQLEKQKQKVKIIYLQGKEAIKYITQERIERYTDTICKEDVLKLKNQISVSDSLISFQDQQMVNNQNQLSTAENMLQEKDKQIELFKNQKNKLKPLGIGICSGYGTDFKNGLTPFVGVGVSYNLIRF